MAENINFDRNNRKFIESLKFGKNKGYARKLEFCQTSRKTSKMQEIANYKQVMVT